MSDNQPIVNVTAPKDGKKKNKRRQRERMNFNPEKTMITLSRKDLAAAEYLILQAEALRWVQAAVNTRITEGASHLKLSDDNLHSHLADGVVLCDLALSIDPKSLDASSVHKAKQGESLPAFQSMENISLFLSACRKLGVKDTELFTSVSLYEKKNLLRVITALRNLGRRAPEFGLPALKTIEPGEMDFSREELRSCQQMISNMKVDIEQLVQSSNNRMASKMAVPVGQSAAAAIAEVKEEEKEEGVTIPEVLSIKVVDPQKTYDSEEHIISEWWTYTSYLVKTETKEKNYEIRRRYKDFLWLQDELIARNPDTDLPELPSKRTFFDKIGDFFAGQSEEFIEARRAGLEDFLNNCIWHYHLREDKAVVMFLQEDIKLIEDNVFWGFKKKVSTKEGEEEKE